MIDSYIFRDIAAYIKNKKRTDYLENHNEKVEGDKLHKCIGYHSIRFMKLCRFINMHYVKDVGFRIAHCVNSKYYTCGNMRIYDLIIVDDNTIRMHFKGTSICNYPMFMIFHYYKKEGLWATTDDPGVVNPLLLVLNFEDYRVTLFSLLKNYLEI